MTLEAKLRLPAEECWLRENEAAVILGYSPRTLARQRQAENGPIYSRRGRRIFYCRAALNAWLSKGQAA